MKIEQVMGCVPRLSGVLGLFLEESYQFNKLK